VNVVTVRKEPTELQLMNSTLQQGGTSMNPIRYLGVALLFVLGCQGTPTVTRTGDVKDIIIGDNLTSSETTVNTGDEVRWVNKRTQPVRVIFLDAFDKQLSCKNNFGGLMTPRDTAKLATNETASVCFRDPGYFRYIVRMESAKTTGDISVQGVIKVGGQGGQAVGQTSDQNRGRTSGQTSDQTSDQKTGRTSDQTSGQTSEQTSGRTSGQTSDKTSSPRSSTSTTTSTTTTTEGASGPTTDQASGTTKPPQ
jgi:plastocyanin